MKNYFLLLLVALGLAVSGCSKDEESDELQVEWIVGTWEMKKGERFILTPGFDSYIESWKISIAQITFSSSDSWTGTEYFSGGGTYTITDRILHFKQIESTPNWEITWKILSLSQHQMVVYWEKVGTVTYIPSDLSDSHYF